MGATTCRVDGCARPYYGRHYCRMHYDRVRRHGDPGEPELQRIMGATICRLEGCERTLGAFRGRGYCSMHYQRLRAHGDPGEPEPRRAVGGGYLTTDGYRIVRAGGHPNGDVQGAILEHRLVMSRALGRALLPTETVHHRNGVRHDNRLENLELRAGQHGMGQRVPDLVASAVQVLRQYAPGLLTDHPTH